ncbi:hypothetical protein N7478_000469 [Penicillium angulare]|uniref:uncharacterized protein n=1 Tax=Penicillium angulare TaxID=116970 RepID=UPI0025421434|nr:uncharacterized protein N7478_000469 [Penicillium angulare]KAJ5291218.1 hypothetical protein N7478_000469 [Penicillium angulare]
MGTKSALLQALKSEQDNQILLLQEFVRAPSPNPPGDTTAAAKPNVVGEFQGGKGPGPRVVFNGHIDIFPVGDNMNGWTRDPCSGDLKDGKIHGRGVVDMKSGTASLVIAYSYLYARRQSLRGSVALSAVSDEETGGSWGTAFLIAQDRGRWDDDVTLSAEPSGQTFRFSEREL